MVDCSNMGPPNQGNVWKVMKNIQWPNFIPIKGHGFTFEPRATFGRFFKVKTHPHIIFQPENHFITFWFHILFFIWHLFLRGLKAGVLEKSFKQPRKCGAGVSNKARL